MMNILCNRLHRIFIKLFILPCHGVEIGCNRKLCFAILIAKPDIPSTITRSQFKLLAIGTIPGLLVILVLAYVDEAEVLPGSWLVLAGINTIAHLAHHGKKGVTVLAEDTEGIACLWLWCCLIARFDRVNQVAVLAHLYGNGISTCLGDVHAAAFSESVILPSASV